MCLRVPMRGLGKMAEHLLIPPLLKQPCMIGEELPSMVLQMWCRVASARQDVRYWQPPHIRSYLSLPEWLDLTHQIIKLPEQLDKKSLQTRTEVHEVSFIAHLCFLTAVQVCSSKVRMTSMCLSRCSNHRQKLRAARS